MTADNMKKMYLYFLSSGQIEKAKAIQNIPRYANFGQAEKPKVESKSKVKE